MFIDLIQRFKKRIYRNESLSEQRWRRGQHRTLHVESLEDRLLLVSDFGDAPDLTQPGTGPGDYQTLSSGGGPSHVLVFNDAMNLDVFLGQRVDAEPNGQPSTFAQGDDFGGANDEDGLIDYDPMNPFLLEVGRKPVLSLRATNTSKVEAFLSGWIDYNGDGVFHTGSEGASIVVPAGSAGVIAPLTFPSVPINAVAGTFARFRLSTDPAAKAPTGSARDGEVEDYYITIDVDTVAPRLTPPADISVEGDTTGGASAAHPAIASFLAGALASDAVDARPTITHDAPALLPLGRTVVTFTATDYTGNMSTATARVTVVDITPPAITAPANISVEGDTTGGASATGAAIAALLAGATASDTVDANPSITNDAPTLFAPGVTVVTFTAIDSQGNTSNAAATVTVVDTTPPFVTAPADISVFADRVGGANANLVGITAFLAAAAAVDLVDVNPLLSNNAPGFFPLGGTLVTFTGTDASGNQSSISRTVNVVGLDFGDAPEPAYRTLASNDGARHIIGRGPLLGAAIDDEPDGQTDPDARGDDAFDGTDDEDGVAMPSSLSPGATVNVQVTSSPGGGILDYFFDFDRDGTFGNQANEIFTAVLRGGLETVPVTIPADASTGITFARFRISSGGSLGPTGLGPDGEVEDYQVMINPRRPNADIIGRVFQTGDWFVGQSNGASFVNRRYSNWSTGVTWQNLQVADVNGDGLDDIVGRVSHSGTWFVARATGTGFVNEVWTRWSTAVTWVDVHAVDVTGDGLADLVGRVSQTGDWFVGRSTGTQFINERWTKWSSTVTWSDVHVADVTGDGLADLVGRVEKEGAWFVGRSTGSAFANEHWSRWSAAVDWVDVQVADVNGDLRADLIGRVKQTGDWFAGISTGTGFVNAKWSTWSTAVTWIDVQTGDFNQDGRQDIVGRVQETGAWYTGISNGSGLFNALWTRWSTAVQWINVQMADFDGDGRADIVGRVQQSGDWFVARSTGNQFVNQRWTNWSTSVRWDNCLIGNFTNGKSLLAAGAAANTAGSAQRLAEREVAPIFAAAIDLLVANGLPSRLQELLRSLDVYVADLPAAQLGEAQGGALTLDVNGAGHGWFIDPTPKNNEEFRFLNNAGLLAASDPSAASRIDLLSVVLHELGHILGLDDDYADVNSDNLLSGWLDTGIRRLPTTSDLALMLAKIGSPDSDAAGP